MKDDVKEILTELRSLKEKVDDVEQSVNMFLSTIDELVDIKYCVSIAAVGEEQIYCFTAMIIYKDLSE